ncbi:MAG TPA: MerR family transcriptional regulator [Thermoanaerobaculia bacterium]|nr:MerR family transcriptional regulator [Thermoanaerobaculia bacterium]
MRPPPWKVGELAKRTGVSVRTLHHYEEVGLLSPSHRSEAGYRLYAEADVERLQQVLTLKTLGFPLEEIRDFLNRPEVTPDRVLQIQIVHLREQIELRRRLCERLERIARHWQGAEPVPTEEFLQAIQETQMLEKYYTPEQLEELKQRREALSEGRMREVEREWPELMAQVQAEMDKGTDPADERVQELARRWMGLIQEFTGGNPGIHQSLSRMYQQEPVVHGMDTGAMGGMSEYITRALQAGTKGE